MHQCTMEAYCIKVECDNLQVRVERQCGSVGDTVGVKHKKATHLLLPLEANAHVL